MNRVATMRLNPIPIQSEPGPTEWFDDRWLSLKLSSLQLQAQEYTTMWEEFVGS